MFFFCESKSTMIIWNQSLEFLSLKCRDSIPFVGTLSTVGAEIMDPPVRAKQVKQMAQNKTNFTINERVLFCIYLYLLKVCRPIIIHIVN